MKTITAFCFFVFPFYLSGQGPVDGYMKGKCNTDIALSVSSEFSDIFFAGSQEINLSRDLLSINIFAAHGINDKLDVIANVPVISGKLQDAGIFLRYLAIEKLSEKSSTRLMPALGFSSPLSNYPTEVSNSIGQQAMTIYPKLILQHNFSKGLFANLTAGYNLSFDPVPHAIPISVKSGYAGSKIYADVWFEHQEGLGGKDYRGSGDLAPNSFRELGVSHDKVGGTFYYSFSDRIGGFLGAAYTLNGRNTGKATRVSLGAVCKF